MALEKLASGGPQLCSSPQGLSPRMISGHQWPEDWEQSHAVPSEGFLFPSWQVLAESADAFVPAGHSETWILSLARPQ